MQEKLILKRLTPIVSRKCAFCIVNRVILYGLHRENTWSLEKKNDAIHENTYID